MNRKLHAFNGGVHPDGHKEASNAAPIRAMPLLPRYVVPLRQHIGAPARPQVRVGERVARGQMIGAAEGYVSTAAHAPTSGTVLAVEARAVPHPSGLFDLCVVIEADGEDRAVEFHPLDWRNLDPSALRNRIRDLGLAGLGGAVFPSYIKLNPAGQNIHTLILNGAECEPWITCDDRLMRERAAEIVLGAEIMRHALGCASVLFGVEDNKPEALADVGIQVFNVGTAYSLYRAACLGEPLLSRVVTVTGHVAAPGNFEARIGTPLADLLAAAGGALPGAVGEIIGGPMMGFDLLDRVAPVTKSVNCLLVKDPRLFPARPAALPCIRCGACARACPADLQPFEMYWFSRAKDFGKAQSYDLFDCIECGCCAYVCPSHIPLVDYFRYAKSEIWERERDKREADQARRRHEFKEFRLEREKKEKAEKFAKAAEKQKAAAGTEAADPEEARKKAILQAALERARLAKEGVTPKNTNNLPAAVEKEIAEIDARRAQAETRSESGESTP